MEQIVQAGGILMWLIILCSVIVVAITIERFWTLKPEKIVPKNQLGQVWSWIKSNELSADRLKQLRKSSPLGQVLAAGLSNSKHGRDVMKDSIEEAASKVIHDLEKFLGALGTVAAIAPLLGLLGTVFGMIQVFNKLMTLDGGGNASVLAGGISQALYTTAAGLCVAIPAMVAHRFFVRRVDSLVVVMEQEAVKLVDALHGDRRVDLKES